MSGFGTSPEPSYPYDLSDYRDEVFLYIDKNGLKNVSVIAHSFGARVAVKCELFKPTFNKLVLTGAAGLKPRFNLKTCVKKTYYKAVKNFLSEEKKLNFFSEDYKNSSPLMRQSLIKIVNETFDKSLTVFKPETLFIFGENDTTTPVYMGKRYLKKTPEGKLVIMKNAGHFAFIDRPDAFNEEVFAFLTDSADSRCGYKNRIKII